MKDDNEWGNDDEEDDGEYGVKPKRRKTSRTRKNKSNSSWTGSKRATRSGRALDDPDNTLADGTVESEGELDIQKEIAELYDSSLSMRTLDNHTNCVSVQKSTILFLRQ